MPPCLTGACMWAAHGVGRDSLSSRSGDSGPTDGWDPASPDFPPAHDQEPLKQAMSQVRRVFQLALQSGIVLVAWGVFYLPGAVLLFLQPCWKGMYNHTRSLDCRT